MGPEHHLPSGEPGRLPGRVAVKVNLQAEWEGYMGDGEGHSGERLLEQDLRGGDVKARYVPSKETMSTLCMKRNQRKEV